MTRLSRWLSTTDRFWDRLLGRRPAPPKPRRIGVEQLEDRVVPSAGLPEYAAGAGVGTAPWVRVTDADGNPVRSFLAYESTFTGGVRTAVADLTGDGVNDVMTAPGAGGGPLVKLFDGKTGIQTAAFWAYDPAFRGGVNVAAGAIGFGEVGVVTGAGEGGGPHVRLFAADGTARREFLAYAPGFKGGVRVALGVGPDGNTQVVTAPGTGGGPQVKVFAARTGVEVGSFWAYEPEFRGGVFVSAGDLTGDRVSEVVVGPGAGGGPRVRVFDGRTGTGLADFLAADPADRSGVQVGVPDGHHEAEPAVLTAPAAGAASKAAVYRGAWAKGGPPGLVGHLGLFDGLGGDGVTMAATAPFVPECGTVFPDLVIVDPNGCPFGAPDGQCPLPADPVGDRVIGGGFGGRGFALPQTSGNSVRYGDGAVYFGETDLWSDGFGLGWGHARTWVNSPVEFSSDAGNGWSAVEVPQLAWDGIGDAVVLFSQGTSARVFDKQGDGSYTARHGVLEQVAYDATAGQFVVTGQDGRRLRFWDFDASRSTDEHGTFAGYTDPDGTAVTVTASSGQVTEMQRTGGGVTESLLYAYTGGLLSSVTLRRQVGGGSWSTVRKVEYTYYDGVEAYGNADDLKLAVVKDAAGTTLDTSYYRYYTSADSAGYVGGLKYVFKPLSYARLVGDLGSSLSNLTDTQVDDYADHHFDYDDSYRVTKEVVGGAGCSACADGLGEFTYAYTTSTNAAGYNSWETKTVETLPDANTRTVYTNAYNQPMLAVYKDATTSQEWRTFHRYDAAGRLVLTAHPSAVTGYSESSADLVSYQSGNAQHLSDSAGLVETQEFGSSTTATATTAGDAAGYVKGMAVRQGETGASVPQSQVKYVSRTANGATNFAVAEETVYRNDNGTGAQTTTTAYTWQGSTAQPASVATTLPTVTTAQNGPGTAATSTVVYDSYGRPIWAKDADGFLTYVEYDAATGAVTKSITDVDTDLTSDFANLPSGWSNPSGLHLKTTYEVDALGRATKVTDPLTHVTYIVYDDTEADGDPLEVRNYRGWDSSTNLPTGPTEVVREERAKGYTEALTTSATPAVTGGRPTGTEAIGSLQSVSRAYRNKVSQTTHTDAYFNLAGLTYTTSTSFGTEGTNFYRTEQDYDKQGRPNRTVSAAGTISRTVIDGQGRSVSEWVGTDDTPTTGFWSPTNLAGTDMVKVREYEYDGGGVGDSNLTKVTELPGLSAANRVTQTWYDWRNRPVIVKHGVEGSEGVGVNRSLTYAEYDNLGQVVATELYDGDAVTVTTTGGVPNRPSSSLLRAKSTTEYDESGRVFRTKTFSVDPSTGAVSTDALTTNTWYDLRGHVIKVSSPGGLVTKTAYDGAGRTTTVYTTDGGGDSGYSDADDVTGDAVLEQVETEYDANSNPINVTARQRFHDEADAGALGTPTTGVNARVSYTASYYDLADRLTATVDVGTYAGNSWARPGTVPGRSDTALVTSYVYDAAGRVWKVTDPKGLEARTEYDAVGRTTKTVENYVDGTVSDTDDKTTEYTYGPAGMTSLTAKLTGGGGQTTEWVYGVTQGAGGSAITSNDIVGKTKWPDPTTGAASTSEQETVTVNALGQTATSTDRNGNVHTLTYDVLGRVISDAVTALGSGVDGAVRRIEIAYDGQGNAYLVTSYDAASGGNVVNQVKQEFNGLGQLTSEWQEHSGAVTGSSLRVQYAYTLMSGGANHSRLTSVTSPNGKVLTHNYSSGLNSSISRLSSLSDTSGTLESYDYLGHGTVVRRARSQPGVDLTYIKQGAEGTGDAGDQYTGLDRFGRVVDQRWIKTSGGAHTDRFQYTYDRDSNRTARANLVNSSFNETYTYDGLNQLASFARGTHTQSWDYDALGNWDALTTDGGAPQTRGHNKQNEVTSVSGAISPTFDANGNMTRDETGKQFVYDAWNRLKVVKDSGGMTLKTYGYDGLNRRVAETPNGGSTTDLYYSDRWQVLEERVGGVAMAQYVWSPVYVDALVLSDRDADGNAGNGLEERLWIQQDANWNVTAIANGSGVVQERYAYDPFGQATVYDASYVVRPGGSAYAQTVLFQGFRQDQTTGNYYARWRDYSPTLGRWVTTDPMMFTAQDNNLYRMEGNGPTNRLDPLGLYTSLHGCASSPTAALVCLETGVITAARYAQLMRGFRPPVPPPLGPVGGGLAKCKIPPKVVVTTVTVGALGPALKPWLPPLGDGPDDTDPQLHCCWYECPDGTDYPIQYIGGEVLCAPFISQGGQICTLLVGHLGAC